MQVEIMPTEALGAEAARRASEVILHALEKNGQATIVVATGASQFDVLAHLTADSRIDWARITAFHLDEYVGLPPTHPASFGKYLQERFVAATGGRVRFVPIDGMAADAAAEARRLGHLIAGREIDVCLAGIGENCHLAFNDPVADFETDAPYIVVELDEACRRQQVSEGWFATLDEVPRTAITMSIRQMMKAGTMIVSVPEARKAVAVRDAVDGEVTPHHPASILQRHERCALLLDQHSAALLEAR